MLNVLGGSYEITGRLDDAENLFRESLRQKPGQPTISYLLGRLLLALYRNSCRAAESAR